MASNFEHYFIPDSDVPLQEGQKVNTGNNQIASGQLRIDRAFAHYCTDGIEVFLLNEGDLPFSALAAVVVACQAILKCGHGRLAGL